MDFTVEHSAGTVALWEGETKHSAADRDGVSLAYYIHALYGLLRQAKAEHVLMIGCGGGTLATMLRRADIKVTMVDISARSIAIARQHFHMPDDVAAHVGDGARFVQQRKARYDAIVLDAYAGGAIPRQFLKPAFLKAAKARAPLFFVNILVAGDRDPAPETIVETLRGAWRHVRRLGASKRHNAIVMAGAVRGLHRPRLLIRPRRYAKFIAADLARMRFAC
ncbi:MAG TPA: methyltransferase domain-containing protein [Rhizomicrobium sp.]|jgi:predicted O-methyltransferase YrrM